MNEGLNETLNDGVKLSTDTTPVVHEVAACYSYCVFITIEKINRSTSNKQKQQY